MDDNIRKYAKMKKRDILKYAKRDKTDILKYAKKWNAVSARVEFVRMQGLHYDKPDDDSELEFLIEKDGEVRPIEVKAGNKATVSLNRFLEKENPQLVYKLAYANLGYHEKKLTIPHFMVMFL